MLTSIVLAAVTSMASAAFPKPDDMALKPAFTARLGRVMGLLASSTGKRPETVRILFYGQSITTKAWTDKVVEKWRKQYPHARIEYENRAMGGFSSQLLIRTMEADVFPFRPDLFILQVYGSHIAYDEIIAAVRKRTTADILMLKDHIGAGGVEPTEGKDFEAWSWDQKMNQKYLPEIAERHKCALLDIRGAWVKYLARNKLEPKALLKDDIHLNEQGEYLMSTLVAGALGKPPRWKAPAPDGRVTVLKVKATQWRNGRLEIPFTGSLIEAWLGPRAGGAATVFLDGKPPSSLEGSYVATRASGTPGVWWPAIKKVGRTAPWVAEEWTASCSAFTDDEEDFSFTVRGSVTGPDGSGRAKTAFHSNSGRIVIEPEDWTFAYDLKVGKKKAPDGYEVKWRTEMPGTDVLSGPAADWVVLAYGLPNASHVLTLVASGTPPDLLELRVHAPPLN